MPQTRQLAAIMFTDIVGYTALMGDDEQKAFAILIKNRELQKPIIEQYNGRWIKELGDGVMASFNTVTDAVNAAIKIQKECNREKEFLLRIGIHLGEVVFENDDVFGDGVNRASRIQALALPGGIWISEPVHENVVNKHNIVTEFVKIETLKNVREPVRIYQVIAEGVFIEQQKPPARKFKNKRWIAFISSGTIILLIAGYFIYHILSTPRENNEAANTENTNEKSIAVLPFVDMSPDKSQEYLGDGLAEEIINSITVINQLNVIGRTSSFQYKGKGMDAQAIGEKLNVATVLEGSIQKSGNILRITANLIRVKDNFNIWSQRFDKELKDIFAIQDSIASNIVQKLKITLSESERPRLIKKETDQEVYTQYLKGLYTYKQETFEKSIEYNLEAVRLDSSFAPSYAYIALAKTWVINNDYAYADFNAVREAKEFANKSIQLDSNLAEGYSALALLAWSVELDFPAARLNFEKSIQLSPSASLIKNRYAYFLLWMGQFDKVSLLALDAVKSDPADYNGYVLLAHANMYKKKFREAEKYISEGQRLFPGNAGFEFLSITNKIYAGNYDDVIGSVKSFLGKNPNSNSENLLSLLCIAYLKKGDLAASKTILSQLEKMPKDKNSGVNFSLARIYSQYQMKDSCFRSLEKSLINREQMFRLYKIEPLLDFIRQDPRYLQLYHRYGFDRYN